jgi:hypothetical protein
MLKKLNSFRVRYVTSPARVRRITSNKAMRLPLWRFVKAAINLRKMDGMAAGQSGMC